MEVVHEQGEAALLIPQEYDISAGSCKQHEIRHTLHDHACRTSRHFSRVPLSVVERRQFHQFQQFTPKKNFTARRPPQVKGTAFPSRGQLYLLIRPRS